MTEEYPRVINFENIQNFRDLGGYNARGGKKVASRRLYRSGDLLEMSAPDKTRLKTDIKLKTVVDLTSPEEPKKTREFRLLEEIGAKYFNIPFRPDIPEYYKKELEQYRSTSNMGEFYLGRIGHESFARKLIQILEIMTEPQYYPLLFHCGAGKDRTGVLAAMLLNALGVSDADIISDYVLTGASMEEIKNRVVHNPDATEEVRNLPDFTWRAAPEFMAWFLNALKREYGGTAGYLKKYGADKTLVKRLEKALLV